ncbi:MAG TPA: tRNA (guanosine(18)-2'-O)-methyltransferase TrmH [Chlorobaculum parvum]|uniref:tRNA (guanosine(18)-2'-O)-methyltransferase n=1 Tax=Chlorobaculum parvum TaxID=274539 RepID=A0A7C5DH15_9CHLB|nr:tRNA (guanosine(18)-2'-O)-methyltransferase TrmH [Chlorobaculum parvum]
MIAPERFQKICQLLEKRQTDLTLVMDNVNKPHNLAAIIRSCDAVGIHRVHAISRRSSIRTKQRTAAGASRWVKVGLSDSVTPVVGKIRDEGMQILVATYRPDAVDFRTIDYTRPTAIIMGEELTGPSQESIDLANHFVYIPMFGMVESLNVSVAAALILFEAQRQRKTASLYDSRHFSDAEFERLLFEYAYPRLSAVLREQGKPYPKLDEHGAFHPGDVTE